jgi:phage FluMu gp28-like protein
LDDKILFPYQRKWKNDKSKLKIALKARQIGWSTLFGVEGLLEAIEHAREILLVSASERQSKAILQKVYMWDRLWQRAGHPSLIISQSKTECSTINNGKLYSLPANPNTIRGFSGSVYLDEFAFHQQAQDIYKAVFPMIIGKTGYSLKIASTPFGDLGRFYELWTGDNDFSKHRVTLDDAIRDGIDVDKELIRKNFTADEYAQEFDCQFIASGNIYIGLELLSRAFISDVTGIPFGTGHTYIGVDVGRHHDLFVIYVIEEINGVYYERERVELKNTPFHIQNDELERMIRLYKPVRACLDATGMGEEKAEKFSLKYPFCAGIKFTNESKMKMAGDLKAQFERRAIRIPPDQELINDIVKVKKKATIAGNVRFEADTTAEGHADRFWSLALAIQAATCIEYIIPVVPASITQTNEWEFQ